MNRSICLGCVLLALAGCEVSAGRDDYYDESVPPGRVGGGDAALSVDWTIEGSTDPLACDDFGVDHADVIIEDDEGVVDEVEVPCEAFRYDTRALPPGRYSASVVLRDARGRDLTDIAESDARVLQPGDSAHVSFDFPEELFL